VAKPNPWGITSGIIEEVPSNPFEQRTCEEFAGGQNLDPGHDLVMVAAVFSYKEYCGHCKQHKDCKGFVHNSGNQYWMKYPTGPLVPAEPTIRGAFMKVATFQMPTPTWPEGGILADTLTDCQRLCRAKAGCSSATYYPTPKAYVLG
jgi:hypothetical protein